MSRGVNKVILIGNLGADPEAQHTSNGSAVSHIRLATSQSWRDKQSGEMQDRTEWHRVVFFNRLAEVVSQYLHKGSKVYIEGSLRTNKWQDKDGNDRYTTEIIANVMQMLDSKQANADMGYAQTNNPNSQTADNNKNLMSKGMEPRTPPIYDDEIPF